MPYAKSLVAQIYRRKGVHQMTLKELVRRMMASREVGGTWQVPYTKHRRKDAHKMTLKELARRMMLVPLGDQLVIRRTHMGFAIVIKSIAHSKRHQLKSQYLLFTDEMSDSNVVDGLNKVLPKERIFLERNPS